MNETVQASQEHRITHLAVRLLLGFVSQQSLESELIMRFHYKNIAFMRSFY